MSVPADVDTALASIRNAADSLLACPYRRGNELLFPSEGELMATGDLHGDIAAFDEIVRKAALPKNPCRHLVLQELVHGKNGHDGSDGSCELIEKAAALVERHPARVHILMGNHEMAELTGRVMLKNGVVINEIFRRAAQDRYGDRLEEATECIRAFWQAMPLAARTMNRAFFSHSTPSRKFLDTFDPAVLKRPLEQADFSRDGGSAYALLWGRDFSVETAERLCRMLDVDFLVTGHTPCENGFAAPNGRHIVIDSQGPNGKYLLLPLAGPLTHDEIVGRILPVWD